jgi:hypothetical protein
MGAVEVQTQMLAAPSAVMAEQTFGGLVEHPEEPMTIRIADPGCRHIALVTPYKPLLSKESRRSPSPSGEVDLRPTARRPPATVGVI